MGTKDLLKYIGLGERLRTARLNAGKTQAQVAKEVAIAASSYANYENGKRIPNIDVLEKIATVLEVPLDCLLNTNMVSSVLIPDYDVPDPWDEADSRANENTYVDKTMNLDEFTSSIQSQSKMLTESDKELLLSLARQLAEKNRMKSKNPPQDESKDG